MKKTFLLIALVVLAGCSARMAAKKDVLPEKNELEAWQVLSRAGEAKTRFSIEDSWYIYCMNISYLPADKPAETTGESVGARCPVEKAEYMVYDKGTKTVVRDTVLSGKSCAQCHRG
jgi:hypothetical protein